MAARQLLYYSRYGIVDVTPSTTGFHDRTLRALKNETPFLSSAQTPDLFPNISHYQPLFYGFAGNDLQEKCAVAMKDPDAHAALAREFSHKYQETFTISDLIWRFEMLARTMRQ
jgi:hypothetical protein